MGFAGSGCVRSSDSTNTSRSGPVNIGHLDSHGLFMQHTALNCPRVGWHPLNFPQIQTCVTGRARNDRTNVLSPSSLLLLVIVAIIHVRSNYIKLVSEDLLAVAYVVCGIRPERCFPDNWNDTTHLRVMAPHCLPIRPEYYPGRSCPSLCEPQLLRRLDVATKTCS